MEEKKSLAFVPIEHLQEEQAVQQKQAPKTVRKSNVISEQSKNSPKRIVQRTVSGEKSAEKSSVNPPLPEQIKGKSTTRQPVKTAKRRLSWRVSRRVDKLPGTAPKSPQSAGKPPQRAKQAVHMAMKRSALEKKFSAPSGAKGVLHSVASVAKRTVTTAKNLMPVITAGGGAVAVVMLLVCSVGMIAASPFGLFFAGEVQAQDTLSIPQAVAQINTAYYDRLKELQVGDYDGIDIQGQAAAWPEVLAVFAVKTAGVDTDGMDVITLDAERVSRLTEVFWDMTTISSEVEDSTDPEDADKTKQILHITISAKSVDEMRVFYQFTDYQNEALDALLADQAMLSALAGSLNISDASAQAVLDALPETISPQRRAVVEAACQLVGKVNYFWGGKSSAIGWDDRWGTMQKVTAAGSATSGTYRPYGLDCTGFLDWSLRNAGLPSDGHWYIGVNLTEVSWADALPGDIMLFPDASHVGFVVGRSDTGGLLVCHCSYSRNNVVITDATATGFTVVGRPRIYK